MQMNMTGYARPGGLPNIHPKVKSVRLVYSSQDRDAVGSQLHHLERGTLIPGLRERGDGR